MEAPSEPLQLTLQYPRNAGARRGFAAGSFPSSANGVVNLARRYPHDVDGVPTTSAGRFCPWGPLGMVTLYGSQCVFDFS